MFSLVGEEEFESAAAGGEYLMPGGGGGEGTYVNSTVMERVGEADWGWKVSAIL